MTVKNNYRLRFQNIGRDSALEVGEHWGVCFDLALEEYGLEADHSGSCWQAFTVILEHFEQVSLRDVLPGDLIVYHEMDRKKWDGWRNDQTADWGEVEHFGIVYKASNDLENLRVKSQWGWDRTYKHFVGAVPDIYGSHVTFWRARQDKTFKTRPRIVDEAYA